MLGVHRARQPAGVVAVHFGAQANASVRARAGSPPLATAPVDEVVLALPAWFGPVGDLVPGKTVLLQRTIDHGVPICQHVLIRGGQVSAAHLAGHRGAILHDQGIRAHVIHPGAEHSIQRGAQIRVRLRGRAVDQIQVHVRKPCGHRLLGSCHRPTWGVLALQHLQHVPGSGLHTQ